MEINPLIAQAIAIFAVAGGIVFAIMVFTVLLAHLASSLFD